MTTNKVTVEAMAAAEVLAALGLTGATVVTLDEYQALPAHQRHSLSGPRSERHVFLRLPDPPPVAALRAILADTQNADDDVPGYTLDAINRRCREALAEFDRPTP